MHDDGEAEDRRLRVRDLRARQSAVGAAEDAVVMLDPDVVRRRGALREAMRVLAAALVRLIGRRVVGAHALAFAVPRFAAVGAEPESAARDAEPDDVGARAGRRGSSGCRDSRRRRRPRTCGPGCFQRLSTSCQLSPPSREWKRPPGIVPHQSSPARCDPSSAQTRFVSHGIGVLRIGSRSTTSSGFGGNCGTGRSSQVAPPSRERFIFTPKWPMSCAACNVPSRSA